MKESAQLALSWLRSRSVEVYGHWFCSLTVDNKWLGSFLPKLDIGGQRVLKTWISFLLTCRAQVLKNINTWYPWNRYWKLNENFRLSLWNVRGFVPVVFEFCCQVLEYLRIYDNKTTFMWMVRQEKHVVPCKSQKVDLDETGVHISIWGLHYCRF